MPFLECASGGLRRGRSGGETGPRMLGDADTGPRDGEATLGEARGRTWQTELATSRGWCATGCVQRIRFGLWGCALGDESGRVGGWGQRAEARVGPSSVAGVF
jgi:hypothetical protein